MAKQKLKALLDAAPPRRNPITKRLPPAKLAALTKDMKELVAEERKGRVLPSTQQIADYVEDEYGVQVQAATVRRWLQNIRRGGSIA